MAAKELRREHWIKSMVQCLESNSSKEAELYINLSFEELNKVLKDHPDIQCNLSEADLGKRFAGTKQIHLSIKL